VEVQADMNNISMKPVIQIVIRKKGGNVTCPFQMDGDDCDRGGDNFGPGLPSGVGLRMKCVGLEGGVSIIKKYLRGQQTYFLNLSFFRKQGGHRNMSSWPLKSRHSLQIEIMLHSVHRTTVPPLKQLLHH